MKKEKTCLTGEGGAEAARRRMLTRQGIGPRSERTPAQARAEMIERGTKRNTKDKAARTAKKS